MELPKPGPRPENETGKVPPPDIPSGTPSCCIPGGMLDGSSESFPGPVHLFPFETVCAFMTISRLNRPSSENSRLIWPTLPISGSFIFEKRLANESRSATSVRARGAFGSSRMPTNKAIDARTGRMEKYVPYKCRHVHRNTSTHTNDGSKAREVCGPR